MSEELKPCPFCGIKPMTFNQTGLIICAYSMCGVNPESKSREDWNNRTADRLQRENWNNRTADRLQRENAELREALRDLSEMFEHTISRQGKNPEMWGSYRKSKRLLKND